MKDRGCGNDDHEQHRKANAAMAMGRVLPTSPTRGRGDPESIADAAKLKERNACRFATNGNGVAQPSAAMNRLAAAGNAVEEKAATITRQHGAATRFASSASGSTLATTSAAIDPGSTPLAIQCCNLRKAKRREPQDKVGAPRASAVSPTKTVRESASTWTNMSPKTDE